MLLRLKNQDKDRVKEEGQTKGIVKKAKPALKRAGDAAPKRLADLGLEKYVVREMSRVLLRNAEYNPRILSDAERRKLSIGLKQHGMVMPIVWNEHTGNVVGGHQRLSILDSLARTSNYTLQVAVINVEENREKELNLLLNNPEAQGQWDLKKLTEVFQKSSLEITNTGFDHADLYRLLGDSPFAKRPEDAEILTEQLQKVRQAYDNIMGERMKAKDQTNFYLVVVFKNDVDLNDFLEKGKLPFFRFQSGSDIRHLCGFEEHSG